MSGSILKSTSRKEKGKKKEANSAGLPQWNRYGMWSVSCSPQINTDRQASKHKQKPHYCPTQTSGLMFVKWFLESEKQNKNFEVRVAEFDIIWY